MCCKTSIKEYIKNMFYWFKNKLMQKNKVSMKPSMHQDASAKKTTPKTRGVNVTPAMTQNPGAGNSGRATKMAAAKRK